MGMGAPARPARPGRAPPSKPSPAVTAPACGRRLPRAPRPATPGLLLRARLSLAGLPLRRRVRVLQLDADVVVRDRVAVADVEPPSWREVLVQPPEADGERHADDDLVDEEPQDAVRRRDAIAGDEVDDRAVD